MSDPAILADDIRDLAKPETLIWAKLRGYPWWPGRVKSLDDAPRELANIARTQYKPGSVITVYFFGSHDYSLVPVDALRPFGPNWVLYSSKSTGTRFQKALVESKDPEKYRHFELMHKQSSLNNLSDAETLMVKRKRGRPPKNRGNHNTIQTLKKKSASESKTARRRADNDGNATRDHVMYCRIKLQKILLRTPHLKESEIEVAQKMMTVLERDMVPLDLIRSTRIGKVLRIATKRDDFGSGGKYVSVGTNILKILQNWRRIANQYIQDMGL